MKKGRIKWENIISLVLSIAIIVTYIIAMKHIKFIDGNYNSYRLFIIINFTFLVMISGNLLLWLTLKNNLKK